jgi:hypothetical protein
LLFKSSQDLTPELTQSIVDLVKGMWDICQKVTQGGLFIVHSLIVALGPNFEQYISVIGPYLVTAIENHQDENAARFACGLVSDLANYLEKNMSSYIDQFMTSINNVL